MNDGKLTEIKNKPEILSVVVNGDDGSVFLKWCPAVGADKYIIQRKATGDADFEKVGTVKETVTEFVDCSVPGEGEFQYRIVAKKTFKDKKAKKKISETEFVSIKQLSPICFKKVTSNNKSVTLKWKSEKDVDGYVIYRRYSFMEKPLELANLEKDENIFVDESPVKGQLYYYSIRSFCQSDGSRIFSGHGAEEPVIILDKAFLLKSERLHRKKVRFSFRLTAGADGYAVFKSDSENGSFEQTARTE
ncbi:MAG: fibronectin type III domain-containing protein, partial [Acutalibacteraceae bacterium]